ncbi:MAG: tRNA (adenosine(37)-N6)-threonylcarbamoyltransferase complex ATPase subunit type 1 TsaE [Candidatus Gracilibacteria bacterium]|nr:tRNA (adenosine(37)-N6)-threonylcarbamoyltransferase complex ATPase subunit type 1 TsaE [Candidatus Gracilibacteria bacterium]
MIKKYSINNIGSLKIDISKPCLVFLKGDLGAGKTTITKHIINNILNIPNHITSPTYTYYNKYDDVYHFDLYRLKSYDEFFAIGGEDILDNNNGVIIIEWPEILENYYKPDITISLKKTQKEDEREIEIIMNNE